MTKEKLKAFSFYVPDLIKEHKKEMKKNYSLHNSNEVKCPKCNWSTEILTIQANDRKEALKRILNGEGLCDECYVTMIGDIE